MSGTTAACLSPQGLNTHLINICIQLELTKQNEFLLGRKTGDGTNKDSQQITFPFKQQYFATLNFTAIQNLTVVIFNGKNSFQNDKSVRISLPLIGLKSRTVNGLLESDPTV